MNHLEHNAALIRNQELEQEFEDMYWDQHDDEKGGDDV